MPDLLGNEDDAPPLLFELPQKHPLIFGTSFLKLLNDFLSLLFNGVNVSLSSNL